MYQNHTAKPGLVPHRPSLGPHEVPLSPAAWREVFLRACLCTGVRACPCPGSPRVLWLPQWVLGEEAQKDGEAWTSCFPSGSVTSRWALAGVGWELGEGHPRVSGKGPHSLGGLLEEEVAASSQRGTWMREGTQ